MLSAASGHLFDDCQCGTRIGENALDHGSKPIGALRREMLAQPQTLECGIGIGCKNFTGMAAGEQREQKWRRQ